MKKTFIALLTIALILCLFFTANAEPFTIHNGVTFGIMNESKELEQKELEGFAGGVSLFRKEHSECDHEGKYRTGAQREDSRFIFFSQHQFEYFCPKCGKKFWLDENA